MPQEALTPRRSARKRKSAVTEVTVGTKFVKRFSDMSSSACYEGLVVEKVHDKVTVIYEDNDKETIDVKEVLNWRRLNLTSTLSNLRSSGDDSLDQDSALSTPQSVSTTGARATDSSATIPRERDEELSVDEEALDLQLTVLSGMLAEAVTGVYVPWGLQMSGFFDFSQEHLCLFLNISGAFMDGALSIIEKRSSKGPAVLALCLRGGFLSAYTSFTQMAVDAGAIANTVEDADSSWRHAASHIALSIGMGAFAHTLGSVGLERGLAFYASRTSMSAPRKEKGEATAKAAQREVADEERRFLSAARLVCITAIAGSLALVALIPGDQVKEEGSGSYNGNDALELLVGMLFTAAGVFVGNALGSTVVANGTMAACLCLAMTLSVRANGDDSSSSLPISYRVPLLGVSVGRVLLYDKFTGSFCGSGSAFCGTAGDGILALRSAGLAPSSSKAYITALFGLCTDLMSAFFVVAFAVLTTAPTGTTQDHISRSASAIIKIAVFFSCGAVLTGYLANASQKGKDKKD